VRTLVGTTGRRLASIAGMRSPRGATCLTQSGESAHGGEATARGRGPGPRKGRLGRGSGAGVGADAGRGAGPALASGPKGRRRPVR
jgi:hypothetical protein